MAHAAFIYLDDVWGHLWQQLGVLHQLTIAYHP